MGQLIEVVPANARVELDFIGKAVNVTLVNPPHAWDAYVTIRTRDGRSIADAVRSSISLPAPIGTIAPLACLAKK